MINHNPEQKEVVRTLPLGGGSWRGVNLLLYHLSNLKNNPIS
jgi:hypothetical protein